MKIIIKNEHGTGVTITKVQVIENQKDYSVSIDPGKSHTIDIPELDSCHIAVFYNGGNLPPKRVERPSPLTGNSSVSLIKSHNEMDPTLV